jgi:hypothetical protein
LHRSSRLWATARRGLQRIDCASAPPGSRLARLRRAHSIRRAHEPAIPPDAFSALSRRLSQLNTDPARLLTQASAMEDLSLSGREVVNPQHRYGDMPLIVLSADQHPFPPDMPVEVREQAMLYFQALKSGHQSLCCVIQARTGSDRPGFRTPHSIRRSCGSPRRRRHCGGRRPVPTGGKLEERGRRQRSQAHGQESRMLRTAAS